MKLFRTQEYPCAQVCSGGVPWQWHILEGVVNVRRESDVNGINYGKELYVYRLC